MNTKQLLEDLNTLKSQPDLPRFVKFGIMYSHYYDCFCLAGLLANKIGKIPDTEEYSDWIVERYNLSKATWLIDTFDNTIKKYVTDSSGIALTISVIDDVLLNYKEH